MTTDCGCNFCQFGIRDGLGHDDGPRLSINLVGPCGTFPADAQALCDACHRPIRCVYVVDDCGWIFTMGRRCFERMQAFFA